MADNILRCPKCGGEIRHTSSFCEHCGTPVSITVSAQPVNAANEQTPVDSAKEKEKEEYFKRRAASAGVKKAEEKGEDDKTISVNPVPTYTKATVVSAFLILITIYAFVISYVQLIYPLAALIPLRKVLLFGCVSFIFPFIVVPLFNAKVKKGDRRGVRRSMRFISIFNWVSCAAPIFVSIVMLLDLFFSIAVPLPFIIYHCLVATICYTVLGIIGYRKYLTVKQNKSIGELNMMLHFDTPIIFSVAVCALIIIGFALFQNV